MSIALSPSNLDAPPRRLYWSVIDCTTIVRRDLGHLLRQPSNLAYQLGFPVVAVLLFAFVFGSAMSVPGGDYLHYVMPGMFVMVMTFGMIDTLTTVAIDKERGITNRFRSMPMSPSAVVTGRGVADLLRSMLDLVLLAGIALAVGWRADASLAAVAYGFLLLLLLRFALTWVGIFLGLLVANQEEASHFFALVFPLAMISSVFTPPSMMPTWLGAIAAWNPVSATATAIRDLFGNPVASGGTWIEQNALLMAVVWPTIISVVFAWAAVRRFQRR